MRTIRITIPKEGKKWRISINGKAPYARLTATTSYALVERKILASLASWAKEKTKISVKYSKDTTNEGMYDNLYESLYVLACFLEDYLSSSFALSKYKKYYPEFAGEKYQ